MNIVFDSARTAIYSIKASLFIFSATIANFFNQRFSSFWLLIRSLQLYRFFTLVSTLQTIYLAC